jgi:Tol biopolymer transport system component
MVGAGAYVTDPTLIGIWILDPTTGVRTRVRSSGYSPSWSPSGDRLAFEGGYQIYVMNADGTGARQLTSQGRNFKPAWHPDGNRILFDSNDLGASSSYSLWMVNADGTDAHRLCAQEPGESRGGAWRPDGLGYAFMDYIASSASYELLTRDTTDCAAVQLTTNSYHDTNPAYSPDGQWIAFTRMSSYPPQIWVMNSDGTDQRQLTQRGGDWATWSPDGSRVAFTRRDGRQSCAEQGVIWVIDVSSGMDS